MKQSDIVVGGHYYSKVNDRVVTLRVDEISRFQGFKTDSGRGLRSRVTFVCTNIATGRTLRRTAAAFRGPAPTPTPSTKPHRQLTREEIGLPMPSEGKTPLPEPTVPQDAAPAKNRTPSNALKWPIIDLIKRLQSLPEGTTYEYDNDPSDFWGGEVPDMDLGTGYQLKVNIVEGFNPPRPA